MTERQLHVKPALYAEYYFLLKHIAFDFGYNLVIHGSLHRDLDLIAIPWATKVIDADLMIKKMAKVIGGRVLRKSKEEMYSKMMHGRRAYVIDLVRWEKDYKHDRQYYLDISVTPTI